MVFKKPGRDEEKCTKERIWPQIFAILAVSLGSFSTGLIFVWSSPFTIVITQDKENYDITEEEASLLIVFQPLGMICASFFFFKITELLGRKKSVLFIAVPQLTTWLITVFARTKWEFYVAKFIGGIGDCCVFCAIPPYVGEISTPKVRGYFGNVPTFILYGGQVVITLLGSYLDVETTAYICMVFPVIFILLVSLLPESPYQLIRDKKFDEARKSIKWLRRIPDVENDFLSIKADVERQLSETGTWKDLFKIKSNRKALRAGAFLRFSQQMCGIAVWASYTQPIFEMAGGNLNAQYSSMIFVSLVWILNLFCCVFVEKLGRKPAYFYSLLFSAVILLLMAVYFFLEQYNLVNLEQIRWFPLAGMVTFVFSYSFGLGVVPTLMLGELFSASIKSKGLSVLMITFGTATFISTNIFNLFRTYIGMFSPFLLFGICCLISSILTLRWVPETKGKTLEEIQQSLKK